MKLLFLMGGAFLFAMVARPASARTTDTTPSSSASATRKLRTFLEKDWKYWVGQYPEFATTAGVSGENDRWTDYSLAAIDARDKHLETSLTELNAVPRKDLPAREQLNYDLYESLLKTAIEGVRFHNDPFPLSSVVPANMYMPVTQIDGVLQTVPLAIGQNPARNASDYRDILARLNSVPQLVDQVIALLNNGMAHGWTPPKLMMRDVPKQAESEIFADPLASPLLVAFKNYPATIPAAQQQEFTQQAKAAYTDRVAPALRKLHDYLVSTYIPACRDTISVAGLPDGAEFYRFMVRWHTTTELTPAQIHQIGLDQVKQIRAQMDQVIAQSGFKGNFGDFVKFVNSDPRFTYANESEMLMHFRDIAKRTDPQLEHLFGKLPRLTYGVKAMPAAVAPSQPAAYYEQGSPQAGRPGYVNVNTYNLKSRPTWDAEDLFLHEGVPGHHLQLSLQYEMEGVPEFRKQLGYTAFVEGWALYAESLGDEMGFYTDPYSRFGYLSAQMWRAVRLVVDTGIHSMGWSRDQALQYFEENTGQPEQNVVSEVDRYIVWPGQALGYMIGRLKIQELRTSAERQLGDRFDIREFHDAVLSQGALPLDIFETRMNDWIVAQKAKRPSR